MDKAIYSARFIQKNGDPVEKIYPTKAAAIRAIKNAHKYYAEGKISQFVAWIQKTDVELGSVMTIFEVINNQVIDKETKEVKSWE